MPKDKVLNKNELRKKYANSGDADIVIPKKEVIRLPSTVIPLNSQIGGGIPYGKILELFGWESTGKTLLASQFAYAVQYLGGKVLWDDMESSWSNSWAEACGLDTSEVELLDSDNSIETFTNHCRHPIDT